MQGGEVDRHFAGRRIEAEIRDEARNAVNIAGESRAKPFLQEIFLALDQRDVHKEETDGQHREHREFVADKADPEYAGKGEEVERIAHHGIDPRCDEFGAFASANLHRAVNTSQQANAQQYQAEGIKNVMNEHLSGKVAYCEQVQHECKGKNDAANENAVLV